MKILFAGTPEFALCPLKKLMERGEVVAVLTQPDKKQGRKGILTPPPVKVAAEGLKVFQFEDLSAHREELEALKADLMVTCAYGKILREDILNLFPLGVWNIHASLLPRYRGAAPIARAIMEGEKETGITIMKTELGLDTGDILFSRKIPIAEDDTAGTLGEKLSHLAGEMIGEAIDRIARGEISLQRQGEGFVCKKVSRTEVDFTKPAKEVSGLIRGLSPAPLAYATVGGQTLNFYLAKEVSAMEGECGEILSASPKEGLVIKCGKGAVEILSLQPAGGRVMSARDYLNGRKLSKGQKFEKQSLL